MNGEGSEAGLLLLDELLAYLIQCAWLVDGEARVMVYAHRCGYLMVIEISFIA